MDRVCRGPFAALRLSLPLRPTLATPCTTPPLRLPFPHSHIPRSPPVVRLQPRRLPRRPLPQ